MINVDQMHSGWLEGYKRAAKEILGEDRWRFAIVSGLEEEDERYDYKLDAIIWLPNFMDLIREMAPICQALVLPPVGIKGLEFDKFPPETYCLDLLLMLTFPRNIYSGRFNGGTGVVVLNLYDRELFPNETKLAALGGVGVMLMERCREALDPLATDQQMAGKVDDKYLVYVHQEEDDDGE